VINIKKMFLFLFWFLSILCYEFTFRLVIYDKFFDISLITIVLFSISIASFVVFFSTIFNKKINVILTYIFLLISTILFTAQMIYYLTYSSFFSLNNILTGTGQIMQFKDTIISAILSNILYIFLFALPIIVYSIIKKHLDYFNKSRINIVITFLIFLNIMSLSVLSLDLFNKSDIYSAKKLYFNLNIPEIAASKHGLYTTFLLDINRSVFGFEESANIDSGEIIISEPEVQYNITDIDWETLIANENNSTIKEIHTYFSNVSATNKNEYTGMFEGKNLIYILAEALYPLAINEQLTPTLYMLANNGFVFDNIYVPTYPTSTAGGEYVSTTSLLTKDGTYYTLQQSDNKYWPLTLGNKFSDIGYSTRSYHNGTYTYYSRNKIQPDFGYSYKACYGGLKINCGLWPQSDLEMINATFNEYKDDENFLTYYITVSGHLEYNRYGNMMAYKNWKYVKDLDYNDDFKAYIASQIEFDRALEKLIELLTEKGILENTVISIIPDHYPYGLAGKNESNKMNIQNALDYEIDPLFELYRSNFIIWNSEMETIHIDKYASNLDVLPTLLNLFGVEYDSRVIMGRDILSDYENIIMFADRNWISQYGRYIKNSDTFIPNDGVVVDNNYVNSVNNQVFNNFYFSKKMLDNNYYKYLFKDN